jgi:predicted MFS family arabinose efflux permease
MSSTASQPTQPIAQQMATRAAFLIVGIAMAAWAPLVPYAKERIGLNDASLGSLLLFLGVGSFATMPITGWLAGKFGCKHVMQLASLALMIIVPLLAVVPNSASLALVLAAFGASIGCIDVAMNIQAVEVEKASGRAMMSGFHGFFSLGGILGAGLISGALWLGASPLQSTLVVAILIILLLITGQRHWLSDKFHQPGSSPFVVPRGWVAYLGVMSFILFLAEGALLDWSALFLSLERGVAQSQAGWGYAIFSVAMTAGRLTGDKLVNYFGRFFIFLSGSLAAAAGLILAISTQSAAASLLGFLLVGIGASNVVPILFSAAGNQKTMPVNMAIAAMTTIGYAGILAGPALIGFVAHQSSIAVAFGVIAGLLLLVAGSARQLLRTGH